MENYRMGCSGNRPYNRTCGMNMPQPSNRNMNSSECSFRNTTDCSCTIPGVKEKNMKCFRIFSIWNLQWHMFPARSLQRISHCSMH